MLYRPLGRTGLQVSLLGLGTGTRFGDRTRNSQVAATRLVRAALELGVNYIDVAAIYGDAEEMLGVALQGVPREAFIVATKYFPADAAGRPVPPAVVRTSVEESMRRLRIDTIDILQIHGVRPHWLGPVLDAHEAELDALRREGKYRLLGVTETIVEDPHHDMVPAAAATGRFSTALVAYNLLSPRAEVAALPACASAGLGAIAMVAVGRALRDPAYLVSLLRNAQERGDPGVDGLPVEKALDWLLDEHSPSLSAAGCRFAAAHPAIASVLSGTLSEKHLRENITAVCAPRMPAAQIERVRGIFLKTEAGRWRSADV